MAFVVHPNLVSTSASVVELALCCVRLQQDSRFSWLVLIPRRSEAVELDDLESHDRAALMEEVAQASAAVRALGRACGRPPDKINVAALGNVTAQLHVHVLGRRRDDPLWPDPVWGRGGAVNYAPAELVRALEVLRTALSSGS